jgi:hypothetical protein
LTNELTCDVFVQSVSDQKVILFAYMSF